MRIAGNEYSLREAVGGLGDVGTLIPFVVGYLTITRLDPVGVLVGFGIFNIVAGLVFRTPMAIQPMKAIGTAAISHPGAIAPGAVIAAGLFTGALWLVMGASGAVGWLARITSRPVVRGLILNVGAAGGQTIGHVHVHLIPRYAGDVEDPRGGIRWIIPARARYWAR